MSFEKLQCLFPVAVLLHNAEEGIEFPAWWLRHANQIPSHPTPIVARTALAALTLAAFGVTYLSQRKGKQSVSAYLLFGAIITLLANVFIPHIPASLKFREYTPGIVTAVFINLPLMSVLAIRAVREGWVSGRKAVLYGIAVPVLLAASIGVLLLAAARYLA